jgi:hypothetical protein
MSSNKNNEEKRNESSSQTLGNLNRLQAMLQVADENGLFETNNDGCKSIYSDLTDGFGEVNKDAKKAHEKFFSAYNKFNTAINNAGFSWRFIFCYGGHIIIYYTLIIIFLTFLWYFSQTTLNNSTLLWVQLGRLSGGSLAVYCRAFGYSGKR